jgi:hypothetical protein
MSWSFPSAVNATLGIELGKNSFHLVGQDERGAIVLRIRLSRTQLAQRLANIPPCLIGMEAYAGAHHISRQLQVNRAEFSGGWLAWILRGYRHDPFKSHSARKLWTVQSEMPSA